MKTQTKFVDLTERTRKMPKASKKPNTEGNRRDLLKRYEVAPYLRKENEKIHTKAINLFFSATKMTRNASGGNGKHRLKYRSQQKDT